MSRRTNCLLAVGAVLFVGVMVECALVSSWQTTAMPSRTPDVGTAAGRATPIPPTLFPRQPTPLPTVEGHKGTYEAILSPGLSPYVFVLTPILPNTELGKLHYRVGWIEVFQSGSQAPVQTLSIEFERPSPIRPGLDPDWLEGGLRIEDINFDGARDISIYELGGVGWGTHHWWLFDKDTGRFYTNTLTSELSELRPGGIAVGPMYINPQTQEIHVNTLFATCLSTYVYGVAQDRLILKSKWEYRPTTSGCNFVP